MKNNPFNKNNMITEKFETKSLTHRKKNEKKMRDSRVIPRHDSKDDQETPV